MCKSCLRTLEQFAKVKRRLRYLILRDADDRTPVNLKPIWKCFAKLNLYDGDEIERSIPTPTPQSLVNFSHSRKFQEYSGEKTYRSELKNLHVLPIINFIFYSISIFQISSII